MAIFCSASWLPLYHLASTWLQLPPISTLFYMASYAIPSKLHFTLHPLTMLIVRSWIVGPNFNLLFPVPLSQHYTGSTIAICKSWLSISPLSVNYYLLAPEYSFWGTQYQLDIHCQVKLLLRNIFAPYIPVKILSYNTQLPQLQFFHSNRHVAHTLQSQVSFSSLYTHGYAYC